MWTSCSLSFWWVYFRLLLWYFEFPLFLSSFPSPLLSSPLPSSPLLSSPLLSSPQGYRAEMEDPSMSNLLPSALRSQKDVLFGNMPEIYQFHSRHDTDTHKLTNTHMYTNSHTSCHRLVLSVFSWESNFLPFSSPFRIFLQDLQSCLETPERVGSCFLQRVRTN